MKNPKYLQVFLVLLIGFGLGYFINNFNSNKYLQQARVIDSKDLSQIAVFYQDVSLERIKEFYSANPSSSNREIYQCEDIIGFISVEWVDVAAWQGWLNAHGCIWLASV